MTLKLNSRSFFNSKLNRLENFSWIWQWWQYLMRYSIVREFISWSNRSRIVCRRWIEKWSKRRSKRRNSISIKKQKFWSKDFAINDCAKMFQKKCVIVSTNHRMMLVLHIDMKIINRIKVSNFHINMTIVNRTKMFNFQTNLKIIYQ
jgi:hypothetical protein